MDTPKNTEPPVHWDESESESNEQWCKVNNNESEISSVAKNLLNQFDDNKDDKNYNSRIIISAYAYQWIL